MERLLNLDELGQRLKTVDQMILQLALRRMGLALDVARYKRSKGQPIYRADVETRRINDSRRWAELHGLNPHFAEEIHYALINESCKQQMILLDSELADDGVSLTEDEWYAKLKQNLLLLTERWHLSYDAAYESDYFATESYRRFEQVMIEREIALLTDTELMLDLGCATGRMTFMLHKSFDRAIGYDISQHMQARARQLADERGLSEKLSFEQIDLEDGIPLPDSSASYVVMNLGTASDMRGIQTVLAEALRVLKPGGRFFFSFYNRDALVYQWDFLPWQVDLAASVNINRDSLDVHSIDGETSKEEIIPIYAKAYTVAEVQALLDKRATNTRFVSYPTISAILPNELFAKQPEVQGAIASIDEFLAGAAMGAYIIATGQKIEQS